MAMGGMICMWLVPPEYDFGGVLNTVLLFYDAQKSGPLSTTTNYVPWRGDSGMEDAWSDLYPLTGGYYDR
jgi:endoglucanase